MHRHTPHTLGTLVCAALLIACGDDTSPADTSDTGVTPDSTTADVTPDTTDVEPDTDPADVAPDAVPDTSADAPDTTADVSADVTPDVAPDDTDTTGGCTLDNDCLAQFIVPPNACVAPRCIDNTCQLGPRLCDDADPCTLDACDPRSGCLHPELTVDVGSSRFWLCPGPLAQSDAQNACLDRGSELAAPDAAADASALVTLLNDYGLPSAFLSSFTPTLCASDKRIVVPTCKTLSATDGCTADHDCFAELPFICEVQCNDGDPCTRDFVGPDNLCTTDDGSCDDDNACTTDACDPRSGCVHTPTTCLDDNACTTDRCDPETGTCTHLPIRHPWAASRDLLECPGALTWPAARTLCAANGAILAMPTSDAQAALLTDLAASPGATPELWAPLRQQDGGNQPWYWVDNGGTGTPPWCPDVAPNFSEAGYCAHWDTARGCLTNNPCTDTRSFGCIIDTSVP